jgi:tRNA-Thr(GGU) m(6)t(6)A37 methyltransferase TsaA
VIIEPIGIIHTPYSSKVGCPIQPLYAADAIGRVEVFAAYAAGLKDIEGFSHLYLLYHFDRAGEIELVRPTFLDDEPHGVFATRHPCRPNSIGISIVRLKERVGNLLVVEGIDVLDKTPLLDIKPYVPEFENAHDVRVGWLEQAKGQIRTRKSDKRFS